VFVDVSGYEDEIDRLRLLLMRRINHKLIFGTDWPVFRMRATLKEVLHTLSNDREIQASLQGKAWQNFMGGTIYRLLFEHVDKGCGAD
jgi:predicted TIM-barrel fold metal-dependent hydrolase